MGTIENKYRTDMMTAQKQLLNDAVANARTSKTQRSPKDHWHRPVAHGVWSSVSCQFASCVLESESRADLYDVSSLLTTPSHGYYCTPVSNVNAIPMVVSNFSDTFYHGPLFHPVSRPIGAPPRHHAFFPETTAIGTPRKPSLNFHYALACLSVETPLPHSPATTSAFYEEDPVKS